MTIVTAGRDATYRLDNRQTVIQNAAMPTTGPQLRRLRRASEITTVAIAARLGISRQTLWTIERSAVVAQDRADAYRQAVRDITEASQTPGEAA